MKLPLILVLLLANPLLSEELPQLTATQLILRDPSNEELKEYLINGFEIQQIESAFSLRQPAAIVKSSGLRAVPDVSVQQPLTSSSFLYVVLKVSNQEKADAYIRSLKAKNNS